MHPEETSIQTPAAAATSSSPAPTSPVGELDAIGKTTRRLDFLSCLLAASVLAIFEMGPAIAKKGFGASDFEIALITSGHSLGLLFTFFTAHLAARSDKMPLVFWPELAARACLGLMFFIRPGFAIGFVALHALAQLLQAVTVPVRVTIYRLNFPSTMRGRIVGRNRQVQFAFMAVLALAISAALEWSTGNAELTELLGSSPLDVNLMINYMIPSIACLGLVGSFVFRAIPVRRDGQDVREPTTSLAETARKFWRVWREDHRFRRYEAFFLVFGFANIMSIPLTQIHAVDVLEADYLDMALLNVVLVQGVMAATMVFWGRLLDRYPPTFLRGVLNLLFAVDFLTFALAPSLGWVFAGRVFRGIALGGGTLVWMLGSLHYAKTPKDVPIYLGIHTVLTGMRWAVAPFVGVWLKSISGTDARPIFLLSFVIVTVTAFFMLREARDDRPPDLDGPPMPAPRTPGA